MTLKRPPIFTRIMLLVAALITVLGAVFIVITYIVATNFYASTTQLLNKDVATHIARFTAPFGKNGLDTKKADSVFHNAMVLSPNAEVYFLDNAGKVIYFHESPEPVLLKQIPLAAIKKHIASAGQDFIKAPDPRDPDNEKIFSAAEVTMDGKMLGYIFVILGGSDARTVASHLLSNHVTTLSLTALACVIILSLIVSFWYVRRIQRRFNRVVEVMERFQKGDMKARFKIKEQDELLPIKKAFNTMSERLVYQINRLTKSESDRKAFIAGVTHDLRTPLSIVGGYAETLVMKQTEGSLTTAQQQEYIHLMLQKVRQIENMVNQLHDLAALESVSFEPTKEPFMISELVQEIVQNFRLPSEAKNIVIDCDRCNSDAFINADISMMERVIQNLLVNAVAYSPKNQKITVELKEVKNALLLSIKNKTAPLPEVLLQWLNNPDAPPSAPEVYPSKTSIGLAIVKRILQLHHIPLKVREKGGEVIFEMELETVAI